MLLLLFYLNFIVFDKVESSPVLLKNLKPTIFIKPKKN